MESADPLEKTLPELGGGTLCNAGKKYSSLRSSVYLYMLRLFWTGALTNGCCRGKCLPRPLLFAATCGFSTLSMLILLLESKRSLGAFWGEHTSFADKWCTGGVKFAGHSQVAGSRTFVYQRPTGGQGRGMINRGARNISGICGNMTCLKRTGQSNYCLQQRPLSRVAPLYSRILHWTYWHWENWCFFVFCFTTCVNDAASWPQDPAW